MWYVIISWTTTIISTTQILYYKYNPSPLAPVMLIEEQEEQRQQRQQQRQQQQRQQQQEKDNREKEEDERIEMQLLKKNENMYYADIIPLN
jgi:hypothetical protein